MAKKIKMRRLSADERPLFSPENRVHASAKDKANTRRAKKNELRKLLKEERL